MKSPKIARISAIDPAGPEYDVEDPKLRLDKTDADFVSVIHTNAGDFMNEVKQNIF